MIYGHCEVKIPQNLLGSARRSCISPPRPDTLEDIILTKLRSVNVVEPLLAGIVLGLVFITLSGLFVAAYMQYKRGNQVGL
jgi:cytochrome b6-f complex subunit 5